jgi:RNA recognition motif-containing protein
MNIFVAKLSYDTNVNTLRDAFEQYGEVDDVKIIFDRETGRSKGFGFVEMPNDAEGLVAIQELNNTEMDGRQIVCKKSEPRPQRNDRPRRDRW